MFSVYICTCNHTTTRRFVHCTNHDALNKTTVHLKKTSKTSLPLLSQPIPLTLVCLCLAEASLRCLPLPPACPCPPPARFTTLSALFIISAKLFPRPSKARSLKQKKTGRSSSSCNSSRLVFREQRSPGNGWRPCLPVRASPNRKKKRSAFGQFSLAEHWCACPAALHRSTWCQLGLHIMPHPAVIGQASHK